MKKYTFQIIVAIILMAVMAFCLLTQGCTKTAIKRITPDSYLAFTHYEFVMKSDMQELEAVVDGDYRHYVIGRRTQAPDPNTLKAVGDVIKDVAPLLIRDPLYLKGFENPRNDRDLRGGV